MFTTQDSGQPDIKTICSNNKVPTRVIQSPSNIIGARESPKNGFYKSSKTSCSHKVPAHIKKSQKSKSKS